MNTINQSHDAFSFNRFASLTRLHIIEHRKGLLAGALCAVGVLVLLGIFFSREVNTRGEVYLFSWLFYLLFTLFVCISGSLTFSAYKNKNGRIQAMMIPATNTEKYTMHIVVYNLLADIVFVLGFFVADLLRAVMSDSNTLISQIYYDTPLYYDCKPQTINILICVFIALILLLLLNQSLYTLGSALWPRQSFVKTFGALFVLQMIFSFTAPLWSVDLVFDGIETFVESHNGYLIFASIATGVAIIIGLIYYATFVRFKRLQVVQRFLN